MDGNYSEMICDECMEKNNFLQAYLPFSLPSQQIITVKKSDTSEIVDVESVKYESVKQSREDVPKEKAVNGEHGIENEVLV